MSWLLQNHHALVLKQMSFKLIIGIFILKRAYQITMQCMEHMNILSFAYSVRWQIFFFKLLNALVQMEICYPSVRRLAPKTTTRSNHRVSTYRNTISYPNNPIFDAEKVIRMSTPERQNLWHWCQHVLRSMFCRLNSKGSHKPINAVPRPDTAW